MKKKCEAAAMLEKADPDAGRKAWIDLDKECPGARPAYNQGADQVMDKLCDENPSAIECKTFED